MTKPLDPRIRAALDAFDERLAAQQINLRLFVSYGVVGAYVFDPDEHPVDFAAAADRGDEVLATIGADIAHQHGLPADWIHRIGSHPGKAAAMPRRRRSGRLRPIFGRLRLHPRKRR